MNKKKKKKKKKAEKRYKSPLLHCIPSLRLLACIVPEKSLTKNVTFAEKERRKNEKNK